jgi:hypothetical protein
VTIRQRCSVVGSIGPWRCQKISGCERCCTWRLGSDWTHRTPPPCASPFCHESRRLPAFPASPRSPLSDQAGRRRREPRGDATSRPSRLTPTRQTTWGLGEDRVRESTSWAASRLPWNLWCSIQVAWTVAYHADKWGWYSACFRSCYASWIWSIDLVPTMCTYIYACMHHWCAAKCSNT